MKSGAWNNSLTDDNTITVLEPSLFQHCKHVHVKKRQAELKEHNQQILAYTLTPDEQISMQKHK